MLKYPPVLGEFETMRAVAAGASLARYGDGELKICYGAGYSREPVNARLTRELKAVLTIPLDGCMIGIPTMDPRGPKYTNWTRHQERFQRAINPRMQYGSAFVTRPDSAPWINVREYAELVQSIWAGRRAVVVCERGGSMLQTVGLAAAAVTYVECPRAQAFAQINRIERDVRRARPHVAILSAGPTATCLAYRLARRGVHAVDLGSAGGFLRDLLTERDR